MRSTVLTNLAVFATAITSCWAGRVTPVDLRSRQSGGIDPGALIRAGLDSVKSADFTTLAFAEFPLDRTWKDEVLFDGDLDGGEGVTQLTVTCIDCYTKGSITVDIWDDLFDPSLEFTFNDAEAFVLMGVNVTASEKVAINLFSSQSPIGVGIPGLSVGVHFAIDLILSFNADMDLSGGFWVDFPEHAYLELGIFNGKLDDNTFDGTRTGLLPVTVNSAYGKFQADLRLSIQAGIETDTDLFGIGAGALLGVFANVVELIATLEKTPACDLELEAEYNLNIGAFAKLSVDIGPTVIGVTPTASTTILTAPIVSTCLVSNGAPVPTTAINAPSASVTFSAVITQTSAMPSSGSVSSLQQPSMTATSSQYQSLSAAVAITTTTAVSQLVPYPTLSPPVGGKGCGGKSRPLAYTVTRCALDVVNCPDGYGQEIVATRLAMSHAKGQINVAKVIDGVPVPSVLTGGVVMTSLPTPIVNALAL